MSMNKFYSVSFDEKEKKFSVDTRTYGPMSNKPEKEFWLVGAYVKGSLGSFQRPRSFPDGIIMKKVMAQYKQWIDDRPEKYANIAGYFINHDVISGEDEKIAKYYLERLKKKYPNAKVEVG